LQERSAVAIQANWRGRSVRLAMHIEKAFTGEHHAEARRLEMIRAKTESWELDPKLLEAKEMALTFLSMNSFFTSVVFDGLKTMLGAYLVAERDWSPLLYGMVLLTRHGSAAIASGPAGALADRIVKKRELMIGWLFFVSLVNVALVATDFHVAAVFVKAAIEGPGAPLLRTLRASLTLGVVGAHSDAFRNRAITNAGAEYVGGLTMAIISGAVAYWAFPHVRYAFLVTVFNPLCAAFCVFCVAPYTFSQSAARNAEVKRVRKLKSTLRKKRSLLLKIAQQKESDAASATRVAPPADVMSTADVQVDEEEEGRGGDSLAISIAAIRLRYKLQTEVVEEEQPTSLSSTICKAAVMSLLMTIFLRHSANSAMFPLLGQEEAILSVQKGEVRAALPFSAALQATDKLVKSITAAVISCVQHRMTLRTIGCFSLIILAVRGLCITLILHFMSNRWALLATQILDGLSTGSWGIIEEVLAQLVSVKTGHFSFTLGLATLAKEAGHGLSTGVAHALSAEISYEAAFIFCTCMTLPPLLTFVYATSKMEQAHVDPNDPSSHTPLLANRHLSPVSAGVLG